MAALGFDNRNLELDEETTLRLLAICSVFRLEEGKERTAAEVVRDSVARIHNTLIAGRPSYAKIFNALAEEKIKRDLQKTDDTRPLADVKYPAEFMDMDTGTESIFLKRKFCCPMCETAFTAPALKTGSLMVKLDTRTQMEVYTGVRQDSEKEFIDYSLFHILVCPECYYAAGEREFDVWDAGAREPQWIRRKRTKLSQKIILAFQDKKGERKRIIQKAGDKGKRLFSTGRTEDDAAVALDLAANCVEFLIGKVSINRKSELVYQLGLLHLMKSLQFEKQLEDPELNDKLPEIRERRRTAIADALECFLKIPDTSIENFEVREGVRFNARKFWAANELKCVEAFAQAGAALQRTYNQFNNLVKKAEREFEVEEAKLKKMDEEARKAKNVQKKEQIDRAMKEVDKNMQLIRTGLDNYRGVVRVINPIYDSISVLYDKFREVQRARRAQMAGANPAANG